jgi:hypothetical protein
VEAFDLPSQGISTSLEHAPTTATPILLADEKPIILAHREMKLLEKLASSPSRVFFGIETWLSVRMMRNGVCQFVNLQPSQRVQRNLNLPQRVHDLLRCTISSLVQYHSF